MVCRTDKQEIDICSRAFFQVHSRDPIFQVPHTIVAEFVQDVMRHRLVQGSVFSRFVSLTLFKPQDYRHLVNFTCADFQVHSRVSISWSDNVSRVSQLHGAGIFKSLSRAQDSQGLHPAAAEHLHSRTLFASLASSQVQLCIPTFRSLDQICSHSPSPFLHCSFHLVRTPFQGRNDL